jgi:RNA polymerase sigma-70 factor (ECF subfamily)
VAFSEHESSDLSRLSDGELVARCRRRDEDAWRELVQRFSRYVNAIATQAYRLSESDAQEVFQEVFARTYEHLGKLRSDDAIRPFIGQLTRRLCVDTLRGQRREQPSEELEPAGVDETMHALDEALDVRAALATLPETCQVILDRFFCRDESYRVIADELGIAAGTIASRISRCLARLREAVTGRSGAPAPSSA